MDNQTPVREIMEAVLSSVEATGKFLDILRESGKFRFRIKYLDEHKLSNQEFDDLLEENIGNLLGATREYMFMHHFIMREGIREKFDEFRAECQAETVKMMEGKEDGSKT